MPLPADFSELPLQQQYALLDQHLGPETLPDLLAQLAPLADTAPLVHLARRSATDWPAQVLLELQPLALQAVLELPGLEAPAARAWGEARPAQLINFCLLDRYLRRRTPELWHTLRQATLDEANHALTARMLPNDSLLLRLPGSYYRQLASSHPQAWQEWQPAWRSATRGALALLAARPRDLSQANAERLLSSQVYTDPGHFLLELLQNADDAQASRFSVTFAEDEITVCHDGHPFDLRDVVGLLSIGQSTKQATQIGYFGVGFKSIYEVTRRPRLRSGHLALEIADISVPRPLAEFGDPALTTLVLPLKPETELEPLWQRALDVDPVLLLQLPHLRRLEWQRGDQQHRLSRESGAADLAVLRQDGQSRSFHLWKGTYQHPGPRPVGKPHSAEIGLALPTDGQLPNTNLYSFLPVAESSGLRFIVGSHFDVPVDRERLDPASDWNRSLIAACLT